MRYYRYQEEKPDRRMYWYAAATVAAIILIGIVGRCEMEETLPTLTPAQKAEVMSRQTAQEREDHIDMADRYLSARVERAWRDGR